MTATDALATTPEPTTEAELDAVLHRAEAAFRSGSSERRRISWLNAVADTLDAHTAELVATADSETRLGAPRLTGELARTTAQLRLFASVIAEGSYLEATIDHADPAAVPPHVEMRRLLVPLGPVGVFAASNFPFAFSVAGGDTASALAAGAPVVVKAHSGHLRTSLRTAELVREALASAGAPEGWFALVSGREAGVALVRHPATTAIGFTGSLSGGRALFDLAASRPTPIPFYGELGSLNPVVITAAAAAARGSELAAGLAGSFTLGAGQFCTKPGVVFVPVGSGFTELVAEAAPVSNRSVLLTDSIAAGFAHGLAALAARPGVRVVAGSAEQDGSEASPAVLATDAASVLDDPEALLAECFGPTTLLVEYSSDAELHEVLEALPGSLTATLHAEPGEPLTALIDTLQRRSGRLLFEGWPTGVAVTWSQHHGGPYPATTSVFTSVGATAIRRFLRPVVYQAAPLSVLPAAVQDGNPLGIVRRIDGVLAVH